MPAASAEQVASHQRPPTPRMRGFIPGEKRRESIHLEANFDLDHKVLFHMEFIYVRSRRGDPNGDFGGCKCTANIIVRTVGKDGKPKREAMMPISTDSYLNPKDRKKYHSREELDTTGDMDSSYEFKGALRVLKGGEAHKPDPEEPKDKENRTIIAYWRTGLLDLIAHHFGVNTTPMLAEYRDEAEYKEEVALVRTSNPSLRARFKEFTRTVLRVLVPEMGTRIKSSHRRNLRRLRQRSAKLTTNAEKSATVIPPPRPTKPAKTETTPADNNGQLPGMEKPIIKAMVKFLKAHGPATPTEVAEGIEGTFDHGDKDLYEACMRRLAKFTQIFRRTQPDSNSRPFYYELTPEAEGTKRPAERQRTTGRQRTTANR